MKHLLRALLVASVCLLLPAAFAGEGDAVLAAGQEWAAALASRDAAKIVALYDPEAILYATFTTRIGTQDGLLKYFTGLTKKADLKVRFTQQNIRVFDRDTALNSGLYVFSFTENGKTVKVPARYTFVYVKEHGAWKIIDHHSSVFPEN